MEKSLISWITKNQLIVFRSSLESEYHALAAATYELQWLLLSSLRPSSFSCEKPLVIYCGSQSAIHIDIDCHIMSEEFQAKVLKHPASSKDQIAYFFTKSLLPQPFHIYYLS